MKRLILLSILLVLGLACAQPMEFWRFGNEDDNDNQAMLSWVDEWNELNPDKAVEMRFFPFGDYASGTPLVTAFAAGTGPDIFLVSPATYMQYARSGILADLSSIFTPEVRGDFREASLEAASYDGVPVAMPMQMGPIALFYNRDLFAQVGAEVPRSWDELLAVSDLFLDNDIIPIVIETPPGPYQNFTWYPFLWQTGANVSNDNLTEATFDTEGMAAALNLWATLINEGYAPRTSLDCTCNIGSTPFASGEAAMQVIGSFAVRALLRDFPDLNFGVAHLPTPTGENPVSVYGGWMQVVSSRSDRIEDAKDFTAWLWAQDTERPVTWLTDINFFFSPRFSVTDAAQDFYDREHLSTFRDEILPTALGEPRFPPEMREIVSDALQSVMFRGVTGEDAAARGQQELERFLSRYNQ